MQNRRTCTDQATVEEESGELGWDRHASEFNDSCIRSGQSMTDQFQYVEFIYENEAPQFFVTSAMLIKDSPPDVCKCLA